jgi:hypothetical protein
MTTADSFMTPTTASPLVRVQTWFANMWAANKFVTASVALYLVLVPVYLAAAIFDPRLITNAPAFVKPLKFILSSGIYLATFLFLITLVPGKRRWVQIAASITAIGLFIENAIITAQAIRGIPSHFNNTTDFDNLLFNIMGGTIMLLAVLNLLLGIWFFFQRLPNPVIAWGIRTGVLITFAGMIIAFQMTSNPTPAQRAQFAAGERPNAIGAHSVGVEDGGPGLPFLGWSTVGGDLRVPHFVGLHAMQILPLFGYFLSRRRSLLLRQKLTLLFTGALAYLGLLALLTWQAMRGQSIIAPDVLTLSAFAGLAAFVLLGALLALVGLRGRAPMPVPA